MLRLFGKLGVIAAGAAATVVTAKAAEGSGKNDSNSAILTMKQRNFRDSSFPPFSPWNFNWDGLEPSTIYEVEDSNIKTGAPAPVAKRNIILVRHGKYNQEGDDDIKHTLTALGREQAAYAGKKLNTLGIKISSITSSEMTRAKETACIMLNNMSTQSHLKLENDPLLNEGAPWVPDPAFWLPGLSRWHPSYRDFLVEGSRIEAGFRKYFHRADPSQKEESWEVIVCHANVIRYFTCRAMQFPPEAWIRMAIDHCSITRFIILPTGEVVLRGLGDSGHIPVEKSTVS